RQGFEGKLCRQLAQRGAQAIMCALAKGEGLGRVRTTQIERLGLWEDRGVTAGGGEPEKELRACRYVHAPKRDRTCGHAPPHGDGGVVAQSLVYCTGNQRRIGNHRIPARGLLEQAADPGADECGLRLMPPTSERKRE